jgi:hypothetical protein
VLVKRRQILQALGLSALGGLGAMVGRSKSARADSPSFPSRLVFYVQPHGHIPKAWNMAIPGGATDQVAQLPLAGLAPTDLSPTLRALHPFRQRLLAIEGLSHTSVLADIAEITKTGGDLNNHQVGVADLLTGARALQRSGTYCSGGARTIDQELAARLVAPGRYGSRAYGFDYVPNSIVSPFSYLGPGQAAPMVSDPNTAFADLVGGAIPGSMPKTRDERLRALRPSVLDAVGREYELLAPQLGKEGREKLEAHRALVRQLELDLGAHSASCGGTFDNTTHEVRQFMDLVRVAFACDLTRVVTFTAPVPQCPELGYPAETTFHTYAHASIDGATSCGAIFTAEAERAMIDLDAWHAGHFAYLLQQLDSIPEGTGTILDHTAVVWLTELATPTHQHHDAMIVLAGGCNGFFDTGRYVRYPRNQPNPMANQPLTGPAHNRLLVSLMQAMGQPDTTFGMTDAVAADGTPLSFRDPLVELQRPV